MAILTHDILFNHGPFIGFSDLSAPLEIAEGHWPERSLYQDGLFLQFADDLINTYCRLTRSYVFFDPYEFIQLSKSDDIHNFASDILLWLFQLSRCPLAYFTNELWIYEGSNRFTGDTSPKPEDLKNDLIETLLFIVGRLNNIAHQNRTLAIVGI
jgi:hypothetical protein